MKNAFRQMCGTVCGRLNYLTDDLPNEGVVGGQRHKGQCLTSTEFDTNIVQNGIQMAGMIFQTRSRMRVLIYDLKY